MGIKQRGDFKMRIGITMSESKTQHFINQAYISLITNSGMKPIAIFPDSDVVDMANMLDGLILPGGIDIDPIYYGEDNDSSMNVDPKKDAFERSVFHTFRNNGKPIFGICRGFQLIIRELMATNESLSKHLRFILHINEHNQMNDQSLERNICQHYVMCKTHILYGDADKVPKQMPVNSMHHQCLLVDLKKPEISLVANFRVLAWTQRGLKIDKKNTGFPVVCEAFSIVDWGARIRAVQWHPEELNDTNLLKNFFYYQSNKQTVTTPAIAAISAPVTL
jgi:gamma-glutamyl-gamma-aminobutyrate hydrolase PuuD